jgi:hypothetical protein
MSTSERDEAEEAMDIVRKIRMEINEAMAATQGNAEAQRLLMNALNSLISLESFFVDYLRIIDEDDLDDDT